MNALNAQLNGTVLTTGSGNASVTVLGSDMCVRVSRMRLSCLSPG